MEPSAFSHWVKYELDATSPPFRRRHVAESGHLYLIGKVRSITQRSPQSTGASGTGRTLPGTRAQRRQPRRIPGSAARRALPRASRSRRPHPRIPPAPRRRIVDQSLAADGSQPRHDPCAGLGVVAACSACILRISSVTCACSTPASSLSSSRLSSSARAALARSSTGSLSSSARCSSTRAIWRV